MPSIEMKKWRINSLHFDVESLEKGANELQLNFSFSTMLSKDVDTKDGHVQIEFVAKTKNDKIFTKVILDAVFSFLENGLAPEEKDAVLGREGFPEAYEKMRSFLKDFMDYAQAKRLSLPEYSEFNSH